MPDMRECKACIVAFVQLSSQLSAFSQQLTQCAFLHTCIPALLHFRISTVRHSCIPAFLHSRISAFLHSCIPALLRSICVLLLLAAPAAAQPLPGTSRLAVLLAEDHRAATAADLATLRAGVRSADVLTARIAIRALGRLERPALIPDLVPFLGAPLSESRAEAANAVAQAAQGWARPGEASTPAGTLSPGSVLSTLAARLGAEEEASVRAAICESIGRLPYRSGDQVALAEAALLEQAGRSDAVTDRLGVAKGLEALVRVSRTLRPPSPRALEVVKRLFGLTPPPASGARGPASSGVGSAKGSPFEAGALRDARVRRLALETLISADAIDDEVVAHAMADPDPQVRRLAMRGASASGRGIDFLTNGLEDAVPMVRIEALRAVRERAGEQACAAALVARTDTDTQVALVALDQLAACGSSIEAVARLEETVNDLSRAGSPRGGHRAAHANVALAAAAPARAAAALGQFTGSSIWQLRMYAARAAAILGDRDRLEALAQDHDDNVVEAAIDGLAKVSGHAGDEIYLAALSRPGYQAVRAAALALDGSPEPGIAVPALKAALQRLAAEGHANSLDTRSALVAALTTLGSPPPPAKSPRTAAAPSVLNAEDLRRPAPPRARITIAGVGTFELALFMSEAPATVLQFVDLARSGYYSGLTFHRVVPNFVIQGGSPGANEYVGYPNQMRDEVGLWPHVRGAVGISTRGRDTGDAQIFIDLVDNPRLDHQYTVFAQVLNGIEVIDRILEGDVIEKIEILR
jgi:cyclophilin family peptidyl-prolyl cis-trans isomerase